MFNIVYIHTHDSGRYFSPYGHQMNTPNIQDFAKDSLVFRNAYCAGPTCSPSRAGLLTGMSPHSSGLIGLTHRGFSLDYNNDHLSHFLLKNGYHTVLSGIQHEASNSNDLGYLEVYESGGKTHELRDNANADFVADFITKYNKDKPFFLSFGMVCTHRVYPDYKGRVNPDYVNVPFTVANTKENREDMAGHITSTMIVDDCVGKVLLALKEKGYYENTLIIFTTDHGIPMPFMKCNLYDAGIGVALMIHHPKNKSSGRVTDSLVSQIDIFPTICELLGLEAPNKLEGKSLTPIFDEPNTEINDEIFSEVTYHASYEPKRCIRTKDFKLIRLFDYHNKPVLCNIDASPPKSLLLESGYQNWAIEKEMLFDLRIDPVERCNLVNNPKYQEVYNELSKKLESYMINTNDPLCLVVNRVVAPAGAKISTLDSIQPDSSSYE